MQQVNTMTASRNVFLCRGKFIHTALTILMLVMGASVHPSQADAEAPTRPALETTLVIFAEHRMPDEEWVDLADALHRAKTTLASENPSLAGEMEIVRGNEMKPGLKVTSEISVFLRGNCTLIPKPSVLVQGALGWVPRSKGLIEPFVSVNCTQIVNMLGPMALGMNRSRRNAVMAEAMARVILHEWVHIATQSAHHTSHGVSRSEFSVQDLLADDAEMRSGLLRKRI